MKEVYECDNCGLEEYPGLTMYDCSKCRKHFCEDCVIDHMIEEKFIGTKKL